MNYRLSIVIPVFNEGNTVGQLLPLIWNKVLDNVEKELIIVESNSSDGSRQIVQKFVEKTNLAHPGAVKLILQDKPEGKGKAVRQGLLAATGDIILIQDADLEYTVDDYPALLDPIVKGRTDFVLGSRHLSTGNWKIRDFGKNQIRSTFMNFGGILFHGLFNFFYGTQLTDPTTMYKIFRRKCLEGLTLTSNRFDFDFELLGKLIRAGYSPVEVPVNYISRGFEEGKKVRIFRDPLTWVWAIIKFRFCALKPYKIQGELKISQNPATEHAPE